MRIKPQSWWPTVLGGSLGLLAAGLARQAVLLPWVPYDITIACPALTVPFLGAGTAELCRMFAYVCLAVAGLWFLTSVLALLLRHRFALFLLHKSYAVAYALILGYVLLVNSVTGIVLEANVAIDGRTPTPLSLFFLRWDFIWPVLLVLVGVFAAHVASWRRVVINLYTGEHDDSPGPGDRLIDNILTNGNDPPFRKNLLLSWSLHLMVLIVIPWLLSFMGCVTPYRVPKGSGVANAGIPAPIKVVKAKKPKKRFVVNPNATISFKMPELDDSQVAAEVEEATQLTYVADPKHGVIGGKGRGGQGKLGRGGGTKGGWPLGMENGLVRFIRLEYKGSRWDDGMDPITRADLNFLDQFRKTYPELKASDRTESHPIRLLAKYPRGFAPPFVYMTGDGMIEVPERDVRVLRDYLTGGGMLFADAGSARFGGAFRAFAASLIPGERLVEISDDDPIFQEPNAFPNGAPPLWHHDGMRALGVKYKGRWAVFYHPGDLNDAWKSGHSGMKKELAMESFDMGFNVIYYAFTQYLELTAKYRKD